MSATRCAKLQCDMSVFLSKNVTEIETLISTVAWQGIIDIVLTDAHYYKIIEMLKQFKNYINISMIL
jgi:CO dehydrogenase/acetyl-CoA synthase gamma subunit (corrinoid Fe-S protein)